jgi:DNA polymerase-3 subunit alpha/error-prone DNA polymerase
MLAERHKTLVGIEFRCQHKCKYIGIARNASGLAEMNGLRTKHNFDETPLPSRAPAFKNVSVIYPLENVPDTLLENEYIGIRSEQLIQLYHKKWQDRVDKMVILQPVTFRTKAEYNLHRILRAIDSNVLLSKIHEDTCCKTTDVMVPLVELLEKYSTYPQIIKNTERLIEGCHFEFDFKTPKNKKHYTSNRADDMKLLTSLAYHGLEKIWKEPSSRKSQSRERIKSN